VHVWDRDRFTYGWLEHEPEALRRSFLLADLARHIARTSVDQVVVVQADCRDDQALAEATWMHGLAGLGAPVLAVVAQAPLETDCLDHLVALADLPQVTGVRRLLQSEPEGFAVSDEFVRGVALLGRFGFSMDLCIRAQQLSEATELLRRCPGVRFVLDHVGKPRIERGAYDDWAREIATLATLPNVSCKLSGLLTEAPEGMRDAESLRSWVQHAVDVFGADRCMYGSDWPVVTAVADDTAWSDLLDVVLAGASPDERTAISATTAERVYGGR
jgi:L-fuconolactonase